MLTVEEKIDRLVKMADDLNDDVLLKIGNTILKRDMNDVFKSMDVEETKRFFESLWEIYTWYKKYVE